MFKKTNTWYKHVRAEHKDEYLRKEISISTHHSDEQEMEDLSMYPFDNGEEP